MNQKLTLRPTLFVYSIWIVAFVSTLGIGISIHPKKSTMQKYPPREYSYSELFSKDRPSITEIEFEEYLKMGEEQIMVVQEKQNRMDRFTSIAVLIASVASLYMIYRTKLVVEDRYIRINFFLKKSEIDLMKITHININSGRAFGGYTPTEEKISWGDRLIFSDGNIILGMLFRNLPVLVKVIKEINPSIKIVFSKNTVGDNYAEMAGGGVRTPSDFSTSKTFDIK